MSRTHLDLIRVRGLFKLLLQFCNGIYKLAELRIMLSRPSWL
jgi:hypothetical protein